MKILQNKTLMALLCLITLNLMANENTTNELKTLKIKIDTFLTEGINNGFSGHVLVKLKGEKILSKGYGWANKSTQTPINEDTVFDIGSNTKQFTGAAIMKLVELGQIELKQPLSHFFENLPVDKQSITIHDLLIHSSGLIESIDSDFSHISEDRFFQQVFVTPLKFKPGNNNNYSYSNIGYSILAKIIEKASSMSYENFLNQYFFIPLKMTQTGYLLPSWDTDSLAHGYPKNVVDLGSMVKRYQEDQKISWHLLGNGGINSTASDMYKWIQALRTNQVLSKQSFNTLITKHSEDNGNKVGYGYGWGVKLTESKQLRVNHNGSNGRFAHTIIWYPKTDDLILFATNADSMELESVAYQINKSIHSKDYKFIPIKKNAYLYSFDEIAIHEPIYITNLLKHLQTNYNAQLQSPDLLNRIGLMLLDRDVNWSIELLKANCKLFPDNGNLHDSLGEAYLKAGSLKLAAQSFENAIKLGKIKDCHWCENSHSKLLEINQQL